MRTQNDFAEEYNVNRATLSIWKREREFMDDVHELRMNALDRDLTEIYHALADKAKEGDTKAIELAFKAAGRSLEERQRIIQENGHKEDDGSGITNKQLAHYLSNELVKRDPIKDANISKDKLERAILDILGDGAESGNQ